MSWRQLGRIDTAREATFLLGRDFLIDGELADTIAAVPGIDDMVVGQAEGLRLVS